MKKRRCAIWMTTQWGYQIKFGEFESRAAAKREAEFCWLSNYRIVNI